MAPIIQCPELHELSFSDVFDVQHHFSVHFGDGGVSKDIEAEDELQAMALSVISVGVGTLTMVGSKTLGMWGIMEGIVRITDLLGNKTAHKWAVPVISTFTISLTAYLILKLPNSIPLTVGHCIQASLICPAKGQTEDTMYVNVHAVRVSREMPTLCTTPLCAPPPTHHKPPQHGMYVLPTLYAHPC